MWRNCTNNPIQKEIWQSTKTQSHFLSQRQIPNRDIQKCKTALPLRALTDHLENWISMTTLFPSRYSKALECWIISNGSESDLIRCLLNTMVSERCFAFRQIISPTRKKKKQSKCKDWLNCDVIQWVCLLTICDPFESTPIFGFSRSCGRKGMNMKFYRKHFPLS